MEEITLKKTLVAISMAVAMLALPLTGLAQGRITVVVDNTIPDIGITQLTEWGAVIRWNTWAASQVGPQVSAFFFQHEMGHATLRTASEDEADAYAVRALYNTNPGAIAAFIQFEYALGWATDGRHRPGINRAQFVYNYWRSL